jgi:ABC-2 type transport system permease protein
VTETREAARVVDQRYTGYHGDRRGRGAGVLALARWSAFRSLGARRGWKAKLVPIALTLIAFGPGISVLGLRALFGTQLGNNTDFNLADVLPYARYQGLISIVILAFAVVVTPELLCPDRRDRVLDLYFPTAVSPREYLLAKGLAAFVPMCFVTLLPVLFLFGGNVVFAVHPLGYLQQHWADVPRILLSGVIVALYYAALGLAVSSLTSRRPFAMGGLAGIVVATGATTGVLVGGLGMSTTLRVIALPAIPLVLARRCFNSADGPPGTVVPTATWAIAYAVVVTVSIAILLRRYRGRGA